METQQETNGHNHHRLEQDVIRTPGVSAPPQPAEFCSPTIMALAGALARAQAGFQPIERTRTVTVKTKDRDGRPSGEYTFSYAPLDVVLAATTPALNANGLSLTSLPMDGGRFLRTLLLHESGEWLAVELRMPETDGSPQKFGSALTYLRRYSVVSLLGVASEEDDDGNVAEGNRVEQKTDRPPRAQPKPEPQTAAGPWRAQGDDGTLILDDEVEQFDELVKKLGWNTNFVKVFLDRRFGIPRGEIRQMTRFQFKACAKLLLANGQGKDKYEAALKEAIETGQVKS